MSLNFPPSANTGDIYTSGNASYEFTGTKWKPVNRVDYTIQSSDIVAANNELVIDFDVDGIQRLTLSEEATVIFANPPAEGEMKKVLLDLTANTDPDYTETIPWDISSLIYENSLTSIGTPLGIYFKPDGMELYLADFGTAWILQYSLSEAWNLQTASYTRQFMTNDLANNDLRSIFFKPDGTIMYTIGGYQRAVVPFALSTPWNIATAVYVGSRANLTSDNLPFDLAFSTDGSRLYVLGIGNGKIFEYSVTTPWAPQSGITLLNEYLIGNAGGFYFSDDGMRLYTISGSTEILKFHIMTTAWDLSTASDTLISTKITGGILGTTMQDIAFKSDGSVLYVLDYPHLNSYIFQSVSSSLQWPETIEWEDGTPPTLPALTESALIEIEARTDYLSTNYIGRLVGRNF